MCWTSPNRFVVLGCLFIACGLRAAAAPTAPETLACEDRAANPKCSRPLVIFHLPRSGSSFVHWELQRSEEFCSFTAQFGHGEVANCPGAPARLAETLGGCGNHSGRTSGMNIDPLSNNARPCKDDIVDAVTRLDAKVLILKRNNLVAQTVSALVSRVVEDSVNELFGDKDAREKAGVGRSCGGYHPDLCVGLPDAVVRPKLNTTPAEFLRRVRQKVEANDELSRVIEDEWFDSEALARSSSSSSSSKKPSSGQMQTKEPPTIYFEQTIRVAEEFNLTVSRWLTRCFLCECDCDPVPVKAFGAKLDLHEKLINFDAIDAYFKTNAPEFVDMLHA